MAALYLVSSFYLYSAQEGLEIVQDGSGRLQKPAVRKSDAVTLEFRSDYKKIPFR
jgi:hypothetical protein